jgi:predicted DNA-binding transcriptional regulator YafY
MNRSDPDVPDYEIPEGFSVRDYMGQEPWDYSASRPSRVEVHMSAALYDQVRARWSDREDVSFPAGRGRTVVMKVRDEDAFCRWVLGQFGKAEIISPKRLRRDVRRLIARIADRYAPGKENA